ncbi:molybdopterin converting factor subunit 1 [Bermanella sp. WJH001]|uniref:molybdopterin converting factor subunit 1 n=1 Tax=Bermanella sp. WJH001 TaxID=3048005 RepID=UPI0024BE6CBC|nr:molybdopterin converting factor subunit 1 [Bermanella sp. WJH001]MDJ1539761.1 molybdopterin converting factor subunit 1 [Bermanella sp. WJH001]
MIRVLFFAQLREQLNCQDLNLQLDTPCTVAMVKHALLQHNAKWQNYLNLDTILCAVNQTMVNDQHMVSDGDEVAFFPPVTGG